MKMVLEGIDGIGKSTVGKRLSERIGGIYYATPPEEFRLKREHIDAFASNKEHYSFYLAAVLRASEEIGSINSKHIVIDRYWLTTYIYHKVMGVDVPLEDFSKILQPDITFLLTADIEKQLSRLNAREKLTAGDIRMLDKQCLLRQSYIEAIEPFKLIVIDTSSLTVDQVCDRITGYVNF